MVLTFFVDNNNLIKLVDSGIIRILHFKLGREKSMDTIHANVK